MNDDELITAIRQQRGSVRMATPVEQIISRGHVVRSRRRLPGLAAGLAVTTAATAAVAVLPWAASHHDGHRPSVQLAAWTVVRRPDGVISVTIRQLRNPAGLQRRLRADGVPASVTFFGQEPRSCRPYPVDPALLHRVYTARHAGHFPVLVIHPSALPGRAGLQIGTPTQRPIISVAVGFVRASKGCTGS
jgi:hypothetical protein